MNGEYCWHEFHNFQIFLLGSFTMCVTHTHNMYIIVELICVFYFFLCMLFIPLHFIFVSSIHNSKTAENNEGKKSEILHANCLTFSHVEKKKSEPVQNMDGISYTICSKFMYFRLCVEKENVAWKGASYCIKTYYAFVQ